MSTLSSYRRPIHDHFEPDESMDPHAARKLRGNLEQIDYAAFASNREVISQALGHVDAKKFQRMAVVVAQARAQWVATAVALSQTGQIPTSDQIAKLAQLRSAFEEMSEAYDGMRRMVERGYLPFDAPVA